MSQIRRRQIGGGEALIEMPDYFKIICEVYEANHELRLGYFIDNTRVPDIIVDNEKVRLYYDYYLDLSIGKHVIYYKPDVTKFTSSCYMEYPTFDDQSNGNNLGKVSYFRIPYNYSAKLGNQRYWTLNRKIDIIENLASTPQYSTGYNAGDSGVNFDAYYVPIGVKQLWLNMGKGCVYRHIDKVFEKNFKYKPV